MGFYLAVAALGISIHLMATTLFARYLPLFLRADWLMMLAVFVSLLRPTLATTGLVIFLGALADTTSSAMFGTHIVFYWVAGILVRKVNKRLELDSPLRMGGLLFLFGLGEGAVLAREAVGWRLFLPPDIFLVFSQAFLVGIGGGLFHYLYFRLHPVESLSESR